MDLEPSKRELVEALHKLRQRRFAEIDMGQMLESAERCLGEGELLYCLVFLKIAGLVHRLKVHSGCWTARSRD